MAGELTPEQQEAAYVAGMWKIPIYIHGPQSPNGVWCATCTAITIDLVSRDKGVRKLFQGMHDSAVQQKREFITMDLPELDNVQLQPAVTIGFSHMFNPGNGYHFPMPVCWTHVQGYHFPDEEERKAGQPVNQPQQASNLIPGKRYGPVREQGK